MQNRTIYINPTELDDDETKQILRTLLIEFSKWEHEELSRKRSWPITFFETTVNVRLHSSISKSSNPNEFYVRTKELLGEGGFGRVKLASCHLQLLNNQLLVSPGEMAYKRLSFYEFYKKSKHKENIIDLENDFKTYVNNEIKAINAINQLNIKPIYKTSQNKIYFTVHFFMPYIPGQNLYQMLKVNEFRIQAIYEMADQQKLSYARQLFKELDRLHNSGVAYLDLKSMNVMITPYNQLRLVDFGLSVSVGVKISSTGGTKGYIAPELVALNLDRQKNNSKTHRVTGKEDLYASAILLYEIMSTNPYTKIYKVDQLYFPADRALHELLTSFKTPNKDGVDFIRAVFSNLIQTDPSARLTAQKVEMMIAIFQSVLFKDFLDNGNLQFDLAKSSLQDLYYFSLFSEFYHVYVDVLNSLFVDKNSKLKVAFTTIFNLLKDNADQIKNLYSIKLKEQFRTLINSVPVVGETEFDLVLCEIKQLLNQEQLFTSPNMKKLVKELENILEKFNLNQLLSGAGSLVIDELLMQLDPMIKENISPALLEKTEVLQYGKARFFKKQQEKIERLEERFDLNNLNPPPRLYSNFGCGDA